MTMSDAIVLVALLAASTVLIVTGNGGWVVACIVLGMIVLS